MMPTKSQKFTLTDGSTGLNELFKANLGSSTASNFSFSSVFFMTLTLLFYIKLVQLQNFPYLFLVDFHVLVKV